MDRAPQPDSQVMPQANVVGVEIGSLVRIEPLTKAPGKIFVIREKSTRAYDATKKCSDFIKFKANGADDGLLVQGSQYVVAKLENDRPIGVDKAEVLAISGCGSKTMLAELDQVPLAKVNSSACGGTWNSDTGNAVAALIPLETSYETPTKQTIPIQLYNVAPAVKALNGTLEVKFGESGKAQETLALGGLFETGVKKTLNVNQEDVASYGKAAFTLNATGSAPATATQTLADVQQLSSPNDTPTSYYLAASNYALLVLGDPSHKETLDGGAPNENFNPRRGLHILAVPVLDPSKIDAGADGGDTDAGTP